MERLSSGQKDIEKVTELFISKETQRDEGHAERGGTKEQQKNSENIKERNEKKKVTKTE